MKTQVPKNIETALLEILAKANESNLLLSGFISGAGLKGNRISLIGSFELISDDVPVEDKKEEKKE